MRRHSKVQSTHYLLTQSTALAQTIQLLTWDDWKLLSRLRRAKNNLQPNHTELEADLPKLDQIGASAELDMLAATASNTQTDEYAIGLCPWNSNDFYDDYDIDDE